MAGEFSVESRVVFAYAPSLFGVSATERKKESVSLNWMSMPSAESPAEAILAQQAAREDLIEQRIGILSTRSVKNILAEIERLEKQIAQNSTDPLSNGKNADLTEKVKKFQKQLSESKKVQALFESQTTYTEADTDPFEELSL